MAKITINGKELEVENGKNLVDAAEENGVEIPHYCYHPGLSIAGQCRMCYVEQEGNPKLQVACNMTCQDGLKVVTNSPRVTEAVKSSLEFHLINHPIDCPICDQAGECGLQEYYMKHGKYKSEMEEEKVHKPKVVDLGEHIVLDKERCILCSRCVRFTTEVSKTREFAIFNRGDRSQIGTVDDKPLSGNYQLNTVDICPVGALTSKDFRFEQRVWFLEETESVCGGCSKGCNVYVHHKKGKHIYRLKPRYNKEVNEYWMCDQGRYTYKDANFDRRLTNARLGGVDMSYEEAVTTWAQDLRVLISTERSEEIGVWMTPHQTNEELAAIAETFSKIFNVTKFYSENIQELVNQDKPVDDFLLRSDFYPNSRGFLKVAKEKNIKTQSLDDLVKALEKDQISHLVVISPEGTHQENALLRLSQAVKASTFVVLLTPQQIAADSFSQSLVFPTLSHYEKSGTVINHANLVQSMTGGFKMFKESRSVTDILTDLVAAQSKSSNQRERIAE